MSPEQLPIWMPVIGVITLGVYTLAVFVKSELKNDN